MTEFTPLSRDQLDAASDALAISLGVPLRNPHPLASESTHTLADVVRTFGAHRRRPGQAAVADFARGLGSSDFAEWLRLPLAEAVKISFMAGASHRPALAPVQVKNFRPTAFMAFTGGLAPDHREQPDDAPPPPPLPVVGTHGEITTARLATGSGTVEAALATYGAQVTVSRALIRNDERGVIRHQIAPLGAQAAATEAHLLAAALAANPTLADSEPAFGPTNIVPCPLDRDGALDEVCRLLRIQRRPDGAYLNAALRFVLVAADQEVDARRILRAAGMADTVSVIASPWIEVGYWYGLADPALAPCVVRLHLPGDPDNMARVEMLSTPFESDDAFAVRVVADLGIAVVSRLGLIRGEPV